MVVRIRGASGEPELHWDLQDRSRIGLGMSRDVMPSANFQLRDSIPTGTVRRNRPVIHQNYSTVTDFARLRGLSTSVPRAHAV